MKRHSLICRLGVDDTDPITLMQPDSEQSEIPFVTADHRLDHGLGHALEQLQALGLQPHENALDLLLVAAMVNAADTRIHRFSNSQDGWTREIDLYVPVSEPALWSSRSEQVGNALRFLTGDRWRLFFRARPARFATIVSTPTELALVAFDSVCLFSGGLDSFIGAVDLLAQGRRPLFVSHYWDGITSSTQQLMLHRLGQQFAALEPTSVRVRIGFDTDTVEQDSTESTQRGRSFLFFALAALSASALQRATRIVVPENGLIALNVPLDPLRLGALSTRTAHPYFLARFGDILNAFGIAATIENPYRHKTKGEMVRECRDQPFLRANAKDTMSCSSPAKARFKKLPPQHCGYCVPCLIRRASLETGFGQDNTTYSIPDLRSNPLDTSAAEGGHVRSFQVAVARLRDNPALARILVHKPGPLIDRPDEIDAYAGVYLRGMQEVDRLLDGVTARPI